MLKNHPVSKSQALVNLLTAAIEVSSKGRPADITSPLK